MEYGKLGKTGLKVSKVGLGCNNFGERLDADGALKVVDAALNLGVTLFDTADCYGAQRSEGILGAALQGRRQQVIIATKFGVPMGESPLEQGASRNYINRAVEDSLRRLQTDYIDLYQLHFPDPDTPIEETLEALDDIVRAGKVRYIGCSNFGAWQIADADWTACSRQLHRFVTAQSAYSLLDRDVERDILPACSHYGLGFLPYFPLASGMLSGKFERGQPSPEGTRLSKIASLAEQFLTDDNFTKVEKLTAFAKQQGHGLIELAFSWLLANSVISSVIAGAMNPEQVAANVAAADWQLTAEEQAIVNALAPR